MPHSGQTMMPSTMRRKGHFMEKVENLYRTAALRNNFPTRPYNSDHACAMRDACRCTRARIRDRAAQGEAIEREHHDQAERDSGQARNRAREQRHDPGCGECADLVIAET